MKRTISIAIYSLALFLVANCYCLVSAVPALLFALIPMYLALNALPGFFSLRTKSLRLRFCNHGAELLLMFQISLVLTVICQIVLAIVLIPVSLKSFLWNVLVCVCVEALVFWNGIICVYLTSVQLGIRHRVIGIVCGMIPVANLFALNSILRIVWKEVAFESEKERLDAARKDARICATKYPVLLVHGAFFRDSNFFNYWGRIPKALENNGARILYGNHQSAASVADSAAELTERIRQIIAETGCEKVNIIAHSKGGLDCRYAMHYLDATAMIASLTTINTPHRGCIFADYLLQKAPERMKNKVANTYNSALRKLGDPNPDYLVAVNDLAASVCVPRDAAMPAPEAVFCQSFGSQMDHAYSGKFPLNCSFHVVKYFDGPNDGLVSVDAFAWGEQFKLMTTKSDRGISHGDMIDLNRENIEGFDVREFYVNLVSDLKNRGF